MARFFTKHEMAKFDKKLTEDDYLNANRYKEQLKDEISKDNHRINIDSAKKKAVIQGMNYDGFHQMVLGADLKGIKQGEIANINSKNTIMNSINTQTKLNNPLEILKNAFVPINEDESSNKAIKGLKEIKLEANELIESSKKDIYDQKLFTKEWKLINLNNNSKSINDQETAKLHNLDPNQSQKILLIRKFGLDGFTSMLQEEKLVSDVFLELLNLMSEMASFNISNKDFQMLKEIFNYLKVIIESKFFKNLKIFIGKRQKNNFYQLKQQLESEEIKEIYQASEENKEYEMEEFLNILEYILN